MKQIYFKGIQFDLRLSFPIIEGNFLRLELINDGKVIEYWEKPIPKELMKYRLYFPLIEKFLKDL